MLPIDQGLVHGDRAVASDDEMGVRMEVEQLQEIEPRGPGRKLDGFGSPRLDQLHGHTHRSARTAERRIRVLLVPQEVGTLMGNVPFH